MNSSILKKMSEHESPSEKQLLQSPEAGVELSDECLSMIYGGVGYQSWDRWHDHDLDLIDLHILNGLDIL